MVVCECIWDKKTFIILMSFLDYENNNIMHMIQTNNDLVRFGAHSKTKFPMRNFEFYIWGGEN